MVKLAFLARFEAKPGKEQAVAELLDAALAMAKKEPDTIEWYALRLSPSTFGVFDTFNNEEGRQKHITGPIAQAAMMDASIARAEGVVCGQSRLAVAAADVNGADIAGGDIPVRIEGHDGGILDDTCCG